MTDNLGKYDEDYGSVDLFGLDEFGQPVGLGPNWGAAIGAGVQSGSAMAIRSFLGKHKYAEGMGALVGAVVGGGMMLLGPRARAAGWTALIVSLINGGMRQVEIMMSKTEEAKQLTAEAAVAAAKAAGKAGATGLVEIEPSATVGLPTIEPSAMVSGGDMGMPPQLVGAGDYGLAQNPAAQQAQLVGPGVSGLASHFGHTIFG